MNRFRYLAIGTLLIAALKAPAQQTAPAGPDGPEKQQHAQHTAQNYVPSVELQMKVLTEKLALSGDQRARFKPILQELHDATQKLVDDKSLSPEERLAKVRPYRYQAHRQMLEVLNDDQKKKLDQYLQGAHPEMHGSLNGATSSSAQRPQM